MGYKEIIDCLQRDFGVEVTNYNESFLEKSIEKRLSENGCGSFVEYKKIIEQDYNERELLIKSLRINYSEFFRNQLTFAILEGIVLPALILKRKNSGRKEIRIWSVACSDGQEAYSMAILLEELTKVYSNGITYRIFATDQGETQIKAAKIGRYGIESLNNVSTRRLGVWFTQVGDKYQIKPELGQRIDFSVFDLLDGQLSCPPASIFGDFDLVICANLLFYYNQSVRKQILHTLGNCLTKGGYLVTDQAERDILMNNNFQEVYNQSAIFKIGNGGE